MQLVNREQRTENSKWAEDKGGGCEWLAHSPFPVPGSLFAGLAPRRVKAHALALVPVSRLSLSLVDLHPLMLEALTGRRTMRQREDT